MALKAFTNNNSVELDDGSGNIIYIPKTSFDFNADGGGQYTLFNNHKKEESRSAAFGDITDSGGTPIGTEAQVITLLTGFSPAGGSSPAEYAEFHLTTTPEVVALNDDGVTYTKIPNMVLPIGNGFSVTTGTLKYEGTGGTFLINGVSDLEVNKATGICYALFVNGSEVPGEVTPHGFTNQSKIENISITAIGVLATNDLIEIRARTDASAMTVTITVAKLDVTFFQVA